MNRKASLLHYPRALCILLVIPVLTFLVSFIALIGMFIFRVSSEKIQILPRLWGRIIVRGSGVKVSIRSAAELDRATSYIYAANHQSQYDIFALQGYLTHDFRWLAKKELFSIPVFGTAMRKAGYISVDRSHGRKAVQSLVEAAQRIADGISVIIFPEGTRSPDGKLQTFKAGVMVLAIRSGVPIVPVAISGSHEVLPKGALLPRPGHIRIIMGTPIETSDYTLKQKDELAARLQQTVATLLEEAKRQG
ncbi:MAG: lysophospholipid acyltransferase family protein [Deltaproteobacteria bacterium]